MDNRTRYEQRQQGEYRDYPQERGQRRQFADRQDYQYGEGGTYADRSHDYRDDDYDPFYGNRDDNRSQYDPRYTDDARSGRAYGRGPSGSRGGYGSQVNSYSRPDDRYRDEYYGRERYDDDYYSDYDYSRGTGYRGDGYRDNSRYNRYGDRQDGRYRRSRDNDRGFFDKAGDEVASWFGDDDAERRRRRDERGRGPANYKRSNERLLEDACEHLTHNSHVDARRINVTAKDNEITLDGEVNSRREKREAEDCVHDISGVKHVQNNLRIDDRHDDYGRNHRDRDGYGDISDSKEVRKDDDATNKATARKKS